LEKSSGLNHFSISNFLQEFQKVEIFLDSSKKNNQHPHRLMKRGPKNLLIKFNQNHQLLANSQHSGLAVKTIQGVDIKTSQLLSNFS